MYLFAWLVIIVAVGSLMVAATAGWWLNRNQHRYPLATPEQAAAHRARPAPQLYDQDDEGTVAQDDPTPPPPPERKPIVGLE